MTAISRKAALKASATNNVAGGGIEMSVSFSGKGSRKRTTVFQFGSATLKAPASHEDWERNISLGQAAMQNMKTVLLKPGVRLRTSKSTPLFRTDPENPRQLIRTLGGKEERGVFEDGAFKVLP